MRLASINIKNVTVEYFTFGLFNS